MLGLVLLLFYADRILVLRILHLVLDLCLWRSADLMKEGNVCLFVDALRVMHWISGMRGRRAIGVRFCDVLSPWLVIVMLVNSEYDQAIGEQVIALLEAW